MTKVTYQYDELGQLTRENNLYTGQTKVYTYDNGGNLLQEIQYPCSFSELGTATKTINYGYEDANWKDKMTSYDGQNITYDAIGNPTSYRGYTLGWQNGRELASLSGFGVIANYKYDSEGIRSEKTVNGVKTSYYYVGNQLMYEKRSNGIELYYFYDGDGVLTGLRHVKNGVGTDYVTTTNFRGDIEAIYSIAGAMLARYTYDAWGNVASIKDASGAEITDATHIANVNPFRYRGYYQDTETGLYYLRSRYYDAQTHRMMNSDDEGLSLETPEGLVDKNYFAYCDNNPVMRADDEGDIWHIVAGAVVGAVTNSIDTAIGLVNAYKDGGAQDVKKAWLHLGVSMVAGAATGALGAATCGLGTQVIGNAISGGLETVVNEIGDDLIDKKAVSISMKKVIKDTVGGAASGLVGGKGGTNKKVVSAGKQSLNRITQKYKAKGLKDAVKEAKPAMKNYVSKTKQNYWKSVPKNTFLSTAKSAITNFLNKTVFSWFGW